MACASNVFPVPVSPNKTTGTSELAASAASRRQRAMASFVVEISSTRKVVSGACMTMSILRALLAHVLAKLVDRFQHEFDRRPSSDCDVRFALHAHAQR